MRNYILSRKNASVFFYNTREVLHNNNNCIEYVDMYVLLNSLRLEDIERENNRNNSRQFY